MEFTQSHLTQLEASIERIKSAFERNETKAKIDWTYYQDSEQLLIDLMNSQQNLPGAPGSIECSWALYALNHLVPQSITEVLRKFENLPQSSIESSEWSKWLDTLSNEGVLSGDGSLIAVAKFAILDPAWIVALVRYYELVHGIIEKYSPFPDTPARLSIPARDTLTVALFGDWGTGDYPDGNLSKSPSQLVMDRITQMAPDMCIHLGDVYYAGTSDEETRRLLPSWYRAPLGNFTMNSNHEMYDGANGLIGTALADPIFSEQQGTTYFAIEFEDWVILGLDSAYFSKSHLFMEGALGAPDHLDQIEFMKSIDTKEKKLLVLTHHNPIPETGSGSPYSLWNEVTEHIAPDIWYWGHIHNGIVYKDRKANPADSASKSIKCRCLGNAAIPFGNASWFESNPQIQFYSHTQLPDATEKQKNRCTNGFAILEFSATGLTETWYDQNGVRQWPLLGNRPS